MNDAADAVARAAGCVRMDAAAKAAWGDAATAQGVPLGVGEHPDDFARVWVPVGMVTQWERG